MDDEPPLGPDGDLNAQMVNDAVVPLLIKAFENGAYDPYSTPQTRRAIDLLEVVEGLAGKDSRKFTVSTALVSISPLIDAPQALLKAATTSIASHINLLSDNIAACQHPQATQRPAFDPSSRPALQRYIRRRIKLLRNVLLWRRAAPEDIRAQTAILCRNVLRPVLEKSWLGGGRELAETVCDSNRSTNRIVQITG